MAEITAAAVKQLRELTNLPMMDCKKALTEAEGDQDKAVEILRAQVGKLMLKRGENITSEGCMRIAISDDGKTGAMIELQCESAPVAKNEDFLKLADGCVQQLLTGPGADTPEDLLDQPAPNAEGKTLRDLYEDVVNRIREKIVLSRIVRVAGPVGGYIHHDGKQGVLFQAEGEATAEELLRDIAMHVAAMKPAVANVEDLDADTVQAERDRLSEDARKTGKPDGVIAKIVDGRMKNFYIEQGVLVEQPFVKEESKNVRQVLAEKGLKAGGFTRWIIGAEG